MKGELLNFADFKEPFRSIFMSHFMYENTHHRDHHVEWINLSNYTIFITL